MAHRLLLEALMKALASRYSEMVAIKSIRFLLILNTGAVLLTGQKLNPWITLHLTPPACLVLIAVRPLLLVRQRRIILTSIPMVCHRSYRKQ